MDDAFLFICIVGGFLLLGYCGSTENCRKDCLKTGESFTACQNACK